MSEAPATDAERQAQATQLERTQWVWSQLHRNKSKRSTSSSRSIRFKRPKVRTTSGENGSWCFAFCQDIVCRALSEVDEHVEARTRLATIDDLALPTLRFETVLVPCIITELYHVHIMPSRRRAHRLQTNASEMEGLKRVAFSSKGMNHFRQFRNWWICS